MKTKITKTYTINFTSERLVKRFENLLRLLHRSSTDGHSGTFGMPLDGDGYEQITVENLETNVDTGKPARYGYDIELAYNDCFSGVFIDRDRTEASRERYYKMCEREQKR